MFLYYLYVEIYHNYIIINTMLSYGYTKCTDVDTVEYLGKAAS